MSDQPKKEVPPSAVPYDVTEVPKRVMVEHTRMLLSASVGGKEGMADCARDMYFHGMLYGYLLESTAGFGEEFGPQRCLLDAADAGRALYRKVREAGGAQT